VDVSDPAIVVTLIALVAIALAILASRLVAVATAEVAAMFGDEDPELSRIRPRA
jgi:hypothetical protein